MKTIKVTGCKDCPFLRMNFMTLSFYCKRSEQNLKKDLKTPTWCPLKTSPIKVELKTKSK